MKLHKLKEIHKHFTDGERTRAVDLIDMYDTYLFWSDYAEFLNNRYVDPEFKMQAFRDVVIAYFRVRRV